MSYLLDLTKQSNYQNTTIRELDISLDKKDIAEPDETITNDIKKANIGKITFLEKFPSF